MSERSSFANSHLAVQELLRETAAAEAGGLQLGQARVVGVEGRRVVLALENGGQGTVSARMAVGQGYAAAVGDE
ncbi:MAG: hypothetical protein EBZ74_10020, partial [Planctomycetia bacterium]|nr:hypothetical protein [Planctomycetia bacterium]